MKFRVYATRHACLVVPDCMQAPQAASDRFGPLEFAGEIDEADLDPAELAKILGDIDASSYALVADPLAKRLLRSVAREHA
ncbi:MAG: hypothetical protein ACTHOC_02390 [Luteimonas sp.]